MLAIVFAALVDFYLTGSRVDKLYEYCMLSMYSLPAWLSLAFVLPLRIHAVRLQECRGQWTEKGVYFRLLMAWGHNRPRVTKRQYRS